MKNLINILIFSENFLKMYVGLGIYPSFAMISIFQNIKTKKVHDVFQTGKTEDFLNILIEKHL